MNRVLKLELFSRIFNVVSKTQLLVRTSLYELWIVGLIFMTIDYKNYKYFTQAVISIFVLFYYI